MTEIDKSFAKQTADGNGCAVKVLLDTMPSLEERTRALRQLQSEGKASHKADRYWDLYLDYNAYGGVVQDAHIDTALKLRQDGETFVLYEENLDVETGLRSSTCTDHFENKNLH